ncbi:MAG: CRISPR-associated protein Cas4 [Deltaproteobacteria bacterium]
MPYTEDELLPLSALQHLLFCERQCALIHLERVWVENQFTAEGRQLHQKAHDAPPETRDGVRITRGLPIRSRELGLVGQTDVVLWQPPPGCDLSASTLAALLRSAAPGDLAHWRVTPVEYKRGKPKSNDCDRVQLCAQALCLEEMLGVSIEIGELFYGAKRRRFEVPLDAALRASTRETAVRLHALIARGRTPPARREPKCDTCSLLPICLPDAVAPTRSASRFVRQALAAVLANSGPSTDEER